jgi:ABC-type polar amino acid transport system ATPase subunit
MIDVTPAPFWAAMIETDKRYDRWQICRFVPPSNVLIDVVVAVTGTGAPQHRRRNQFLSLLGHGAQFPDRRRGSHRGLSGGQQQRVAIARALALDPRIVLFDEPTSALDPELVGSVLQVMRDLRESGMTMVVVSHELSFARAAADRVVFMDHGKIVEQGPPAQIFAAAESQRVREFVATIGGHR